MDQKCLWILLLSGLVIVLELLFMSLYFILVHKCWLCFLSVFSSFFFLCQLESFSLPLQWTGETQWVGIVLLSSNFLPQIQRLRWQASSILCADLLMQQKENPVLWLHRHLMLLFVLTCEWVESCTALAGPEKQGQGGTSSSNGNRDATFMLPNWDWQQELHIFRIVQQFFHSLGGEGAAVSSVNILNFPLAWRRKE